MSTGDAGKAVTYGCFGSFGVMLFFVFLRASGVVFGIVMCAGGIFFTGKAVDTAAGVANDAAKEIEKNLADQRERDKKAADAQAVADREAAAIAAKEKARNDAAAANVQPPDAAPDALPEPDPVEAKAAAERAKKAADAVAAQEQAEKDRQERIKQEKDEKSAAGKLRLAEQFLKDGKAEAYRRALKDLAEKYPDTEAGKKAAKLLK